MLVIEQYNSLFSIYMYLLMVLPAVILGFLGKKSKILNFLISAVMIVLLMGAGTLQFWEFIAFLIGELVIITCYFFVKKKTNNEIVYTIFFILSIVPLAAIKICGITPIANYVGFVGVSYICFKVWEVLIQIHDEKIENYSFFEMVSFLTFAPALSSGPIARYQSYQDEYKNADNYCNDYFIPGIKNIVLGAFYKFSLAFLINEYVISACEDHSFGYTVLYMYAYTFYLFFDFAGYSLLAIGTGRLMGVKLPDNFDKPFLSRHPKEFWERWHMSLSKWFNDFLFSRIVLNGMRKKIFKSPKTASRVAYLCTMLVMGFWHGLFVHYILYGLYHGVLLILTDIWIKSKTFRNVKKMKYYDLVSRFICFHIIAFGMLIFSGHIIPV